MPNPLKDELKRLTRIASERRNTRAAEDNARREQRAQQDAELEAEVSAAVLALPDGESATQKPAAPTNLIVDVTQAGTVTLAWSHDGTGVTSFGIDAYEGSQLVNTGQAAADARSYTFHLPAGEYTFAVTADGPGGESDPATVSATVKGETPTLEVDLSKLRGVNYLSANVTYTGSDKLAEGVTLHGPATVVIANGKQLRGGAKVRLSGLTIKGGGKAEKLNDNAAIIAGDDWVVEGCNISGAKGVGIGCDGKRIRIHNNRVHDCGSAGIGGKIDDGFVTGNHCHRNNKTVKDRDGAAMGKFTRSNRSEFSDNLIEDGLFAGIWFDINNGPCVIRNNVIRTIGKIREDYEGVGIKLEINAPGWVIEGNDIADTYGPAVVINETKNVRITGNTLRNGTGPEGAVLHLRQLTRDDEAQKADTPGDWQLRNVDFSGNHVGDGGRVTRSGAGTKLTMKLLDSWDVKIGPQASGTLKVEIPAN